MSNARCARCLAPLPPPGQRGPKARYCWRCVVLWAAVASLESVIAKHAARLPAAAWKLLRQRIRACANARPIEGQRHCPACGRWRPIGKSKKPPGPPCKLCGPGRGRLTERRSR